MSADTLPSRARAQVWNGSSWVDAPGDATNGLDVDVTRMANLAETKVDGGAFAAETDRLFAGGFVLDETAGVGLSENDIAAARLDAKRTQIIVVEDADTRGLARRQTVLAASTAAAATDKPAVVAIHPSSVAPVGGNVAHDAVDSGNPQKIGGKVIAAAGTPAFVSATGDRVDGAFDGAGRLMVMEPPAWTVSSAPAANTQASASKAAGAAGVKHVLTSLFVQCHNSGAATAIVLIVNVRDGATGAGTVLWTLRIPVAAATLTSREIFLNDLNIVGSAATAMTVEFSAAGGANTNEIVNIAGYDTL